MLSRLQYHEGTCIQVTSAHIHNQSHVSGKQNQTLHFQKNYYKCNVSTNFPALVLSQRGHSWWRQECWLSYDLHRGEKWRVSAPDWGTLLAHHGVCWTSIQIECNHKISHKQPLILMGSNELSQEWYLSAAHRNTQLMKNRQHSEMVQLIQTALGGGDEHDRCHCNFQYWDSSWWRRGTPRLD